MTEYYSRVNYTYSSGSANFSIPFSYIDKEHIKVFINGEETQNYTYLTSSQIQISDTLSSGDLVSVVRTTPINERMVEFTDTSILNEDTQNLAHEQIFDVMQEVYDSLNAHKEDVETLKPYIETAASNIEHIINIDDNMTDINSVASNIENINSVSSNKTNIDIVANSSGAINTVSNSINGVNTVASDISNVNTVANNIDIVDDLSEIVEIQTQIEADMEALTEAVFQYIEQYESSNFDVVGTVTDNQGIVSGFTTSNYAYTPLNFSPLSSSWEIQTKFTTSSSIPDETILGSYSTLDCGNLIVRINNNSHEMYLFIGSTGNDWGVSATHGSYVYQTNTTYYIRVKFDGNNTYTLDYSLDGSTWVNDITVTSFDKIYSGIPISIGAHKYQSTVDTPFDGSIDLNKTFIKIDNQVVWKGTNTIPTYDTSNPKVADKDLSNLSTTGISQVAKDAFGKIHYDANDFSKIGAFWGVSDLTSGSVSLPANGLWLVFDFRYYASGTASDIGTYYGIGLIPGGTTYTVNGSYPHFYLYAIRIVE